MNDVPFDCLNSSNPYLIETNSKFSLVDPAGNPLTAEYIWSKSGQDRVDLAQWVFDYFRSSGFPLPFLNNKQLHKSFEKLKEKDESVVLVNDCIKNSDSCATDIVKHFCGQYFYAARGDSKTFSCFDVFNDDSKLMRVIQNRMGWCSMEEDGHERPYVFAMSNPMLIQGMRSSGLSYSVSQFKPAVAKWIYHRYASKRVFDYSAGWGARALGALSEGLEYFAVDPLTADSLNDLLICFGGTGEVLKQPSTDSFDVPVCDFVFSCPPYFNLENYSSDASQSVQMFGNYSDWLDGYWKMTIENCLKVMADDAKFGMIAVNEVDSRELAKDMVSVCEKMGMTLIEQFPLITSRSHLSGKAKSGIVQKKNENLFVFSKKLI